MNIPHTLLITGASRGIGAACALRAADAGWDVGVHFHRDAEAAERVAAQVRERGRRACTLQGGVGAIETMFKRLDDALGPLGGLVNNAGIVDVAARVDEMSAARIARIFNVNVVGAFVCARGGAAHEHAPWRAWRRHRQPVVGRGAGQLAGDLRRLRGQQGGDRQLHHRPGT
jgi:NAD(P)-dependent dehydrogenase (short-subunit alcohol dehydrogenase family)